MSMSKQCPAMGFFLLRSFEKFPEVKACDYRRIDGRFALSAHSVTWFSDENRYYMILIYDKYDIIVF